MSSLNATVGALFVVVFLVTIRSHVVAKQNTSYCLDQTKEQEQYATPNFVLLLLDDHGYGDMGAYDSSVHETPHMDALAASGIRFTDFHSAASICTPSRAALLTGRLGMRTGVTTNFGSKSLGGLPTEELTIAELLPPSYRKHMFGKWHLGHKEPFHPSFRGFDSVYGLPYSGDMGCLDITPQSCKPKVDRSRSTPSCPALCELNSNEVGIPLYDSRVINCTIGSHNRNNYTVLEKSSPCDDTIVEQPVNEFTLNQRYAQRAAEILANAALSKNPFFLYVGFAHTHTPMAYSDGYWKNTSKRPGWKRHYGNSLAEVDDAVGRIISALKANGLVENTLVVLTSDNGPADLSMVECDFIGSAGPFQGLWQRSTEGGGGGVMKGTLWEGGHRVVNIASWPGTIDAGRVSDALTSSMDILPTFLSLAGVSLPDDRSFDGIDLSALLKNSTIGLSDILREADEINKGGLVDLGGEDGLHRVLYHQGITSMGYLDAMRLGRYKILFESGGTGSCDNKRSGPARHHDPPLVFDVVSDPAESTPISLSKNILDAALAGREVKLHDIYATLSHTANMKSGTKRDSACCNRNSIVCRCPWQEVSTLPVREKHRIGLG